MVERLNVELIKMSGYRDVPISCKIDKLEGLAINLIFSVDSSKLL